MRVGAVLGQIAALAWLAAFGARQADCAEHWKVQYFYDKDQSGLEIRDLVCPSAQRCVAAGVIVEKGHEKGTAVITGDGGETWSLVGIREKPVSLFFLDDARGWMATDGGIWRTGDAGRTWTKLQKLESIERVFFLDEMLGFAVGAPRAAYQTADGGKTWKRFAAGDEPVTPHDQAVYEWIMFDGPEHGFILGDSIPAQKNRTPDWVDPQRARFRSGDAITQILLETRDGGKTWHKSQEESSGDLIRIKTGRDGVALGLIAYPNFSKYPAEVYRIDLKGYQKQLIYREADRVVTDILPMKDGEVFLAAIEAPGRLKEVPIPGKLKMLHSTDLNAWKDMGTDYRAVAQRALMSGVDRNHLWVATDTGMILKLVDTDR